MENRSKNKINFYIYSLSGMLFGGSKQNEIQGNQMTEKDISQTIFNGNEIDKFVLNYSIFGLSKKQAELDGFNEDVLVYYSASKSDIWNYNPILSLHVGIPIYSPVMVFCTPSIFKDYDGFVKMDNDVFLKIVNFFINFANQYIKKRESELTEETENEIKSETEQKDKKDESSEIFGLSDISYIISADCRIQVDKKNINNLDSYWKKHFVEKYHSNFCYNFCRCEESGKVSFKTVLIKHGMMTLLDEKTGIVENYFCPQYTKEGLQKVYNELNDIQRKYTFENLDQETLMISEDKRKEKMKKEMSEVVSDFYKKLGS